MATTSSGSDPVITTFERDGVQVVRFGPNTKILGDRQVQELGQALAHAVQQFEGPPRVVLSFEGVTFLCSAALGKLVLTQRQILNRDGSFKLCDMRPQVQDVFRISNLDDFFEIRPDINSALAAMPEPSE